MNPRIAPFLYMQNEHLREVKQWRWSGMKSRIVGSSPVIRDILKLIARAAPSDKSILLLGETGTGKDLVARHIHELSGRRKKPFIALNCSTIPDSLFEAELFGYRRGAFTGAVQNKRGLLEIAQDGTAFLDEVGELPLPLQAKLLRIVDRRELRPIGGTTTQKIRTRFIFATNRDLACEIEEGRFRMDLYFRISVVRLKIPSLRERREDIPALAAYILNKSSDVSAPSRYLSKEALDLLIQYGFPGNVRELENILERSALFSKDLIIRAKDLLLEERNVYPPDKKYNRHDAEGIKQALTECHWNKSQAALKLGTSRRHIYRLIRKHKLIRITSQKAQSPRHDFT